MAKFTVDIKSYRSVSTKRFQPSEQQVTSIIEQIDYE